MNATQRLESEVGEMYSQIAEKVTPCQKKSPEDGRVYGNDCKIDEIDETMPHKRRGIV